jgi:plasmid stabilization system protein ParE
VKLRFSPRARSDIDHIYEYIAEHNKRAARAVVSQIRSTSELLARHPGLGRQTDTPGVRVFPVARYPYLVYHRMHEDNVIIIHVRDGRRDTPKLDEL